MGKTSILPFGEGDRNVMTDSDYENDSSRQNGIASGSVAESKLHNKLFRQVTFLASAIAKALADSGEDDIADDDFDALVANVKKVLVTSGTGGNLLSEMKKVDGAGSGLDADLIHGTTPAAFRANMLRRVSPPNSAATLLNDAWIAESDGLFSYQVPMDKCTTNSLVIINPKREAMLYSLFCGGTPANGMYTQYAREKPGRDITVEYWVVEVIQS